MIEKINIGFSKISHQYEALDKTSSLINWMRSKVRKTILTNLNRDDNILEINCGTGLDAAFFANRGYRVHATDVANEMINHVQEKITIKNLQHKLSCEILSNNELHKLKKQQFNHIFSNFGGLNCSSELELEQIFLSFSSILTSNGKITLVIMPKICIWEMLKVLKGNNQAFRRLNKNGVMANIAEEKIKTYYHNSNKIKSLLNNNFKNFKVENICFLGPTGDKIDFPERHPKLFKFLTLFDFLSNRIPFLKGYGDYYIISARKK